MLPERDLAYLAAAHPGHQLGQDGGQVAAVLPDFQLPIGFTPDRVTLLLLLPFGYPDTPLDMFWVTPRVTVNGTSPAAVCDEPHLNSVWQRFSRHLPPGAWRPGVDGIQSYLALVTTMLAREAGGARHAA